MSLECDIGTAVEPFREKTTLWKTSVKEDIIQTLNLFSINQRVRIDKRLSLLVCCHDDRSEPYATVSFFRIVPPNSGARLTADGGKRKT